MRYHRLRSTAPFLVFVLLLVAGLASAQGQKPAAPATKPAAKNSEAEREEEEKEEADKLSPDTPVVTIGGFCDAVSTTVTRDKTPCRTVITRSEFEKLAEAQGAEAETYRGRSQFGAYYAQFLLFAGAAQKKGMDKDPLFQRKLELARIQLLAQMLLQDFKAKSSEVTPADLEKFFKENPALFEQATVLRVYIPNAKFKDLPNGVQQAIPDSGSEMKLTAEAIYTRAKAGGDFEVLQKDASEAANQKDVPDSRIEKISRDHLRLGQRGVFDLKPGEVSKLFEDSEGFYIYKMVSHEMPPFESVKSDVGTALQKQRMDTWVNSITDPVKVTMNEEFFGTNPLEKKKY